MKLLRFPVSPDMICERYDPRLNWMRHVRYRIHDHHGESHNRLTNHGVHQAISTNSGWHCVCIQKDTISEEEQMRADTKQVLTIFGSVSDEDDGVTAAEYMVDSLWGHLPCFKKTKTTQR
eukprot:986760_1